MASIDRRNNGKYRIRVEIGRDAEGKRLVRTMTYTPTETNERKIKKEVEMAALEFEKRVLNGECIEGDKLIFRNYVNVWADQWGKNNLTLSGLESYLDILRRRIIPEVGHIPIGKIRPTHIQNILQKMKDDGKAAKTIKRTLTAFNSVMRYAFDMEVIETNPIDRVHPPKVEKKDALHYFTPEQVNIFFGALEKEYTMTMKAHESTNRKTGQRTTKIKEYTQTYTIPFQWRVYFNLAIMGAFRRGELCAIRWSDIDWESRTLSIRRAFAKTKAEGQIIKTTKTASGIRTITLPESSMLLLKEWKDQQKELSMALGTLWEGKRGREYDENYIFIQLDNGRPICVDTPSHRFKTIIETYNATCSDESLKLPMIRLHDLRHTSATLLLSNGADISTVSHRLGHHQTSVTLDVYSHWLPQNDRDASDTLERIIQNA